MKGLLHKDFDPAEMNRVWDLSTPGYPEIMAVQQRKERRRTLLKRKDHPCRALRRWVRSLFR